MTKTLSKHRETTKAIITPEPKISRTLTLSSVFVHSIQELVVFASVDVLVYFLLYLSTWISAKSMCSLG